MFRTLDLVFPIGVNVLLGVISAIVFAGGAPLGAKVATGATWGVFLSAGVALYVIRWASRKSDFVVRGHGCELRVRVGERNKPDAALVSEWAGAVFSFWTLAGYTFGFEGIVVFEDIYKIEVSGWSGFVRGWSVEGMATVGIHDGATIDEDLPYVRSLFRHEVSHLVLLSAGVPRGKHHEIFKEKGLGA